MATANKKAGAAKKAVTKNPSAKKPVKTTAKKSAPQPKKASKPVGKNQKPAAKASSGKSSSSAVKKANISKRTGAISTTAVKKATSKTVPAVKSKNSPVKSVSKKQASSKKPVLVKGTTTSGKSSKMISANVKATVVKPKSTAKQLHAQSAPKTKATTESPKPAPKASGKPVAGKPKQPEQQDPLHTKAQKAIRELEETMDLSKMRPRIQAGSPAPKPLPKKPQSFPKLPEPVSTGGKVKYQLEFEFRSSPKILFTSLSDSSGLAGWFADEVHTKDDLFTFVWEGGESYARLIALHEPQLVRFQWLEDAADGTYFQFEIKEDDITSDIALVITDFAYPGEKDTNIRLWESQVQKLRMLLGSL